MSFFERFSNSKFFIVCDYIYKIVVLNIFFLCTLILGLVVFSLIPSLTAYFTVVKGFNSSREFSIIDGYFTSFFHSLKKNVVLSIEYSLLLALLIFNCIYFYEGIRDYKVITINSHNYEYNINNENIFTMNKKDQIILNSRNKVFILDYEKSDIIKYDEKTNNIFSDGLAIILNFEGQIQQIRSGDGYFLNLEKENNNYIESDNLNLLWNSENKNIFINLYEEIPEEGYVLLTSPKSLYGLADEILLNIKEELANNNLINLKLYNEEVEQININANKQIDKTFGIVCYYIMLFCTILLFLMILNTSLINVYFPYLNKKKTVKYSFNFIVSFPLKTILIISLTVAFIYLTTLFIYLLPVIIISLYLFLVHIIYKKDYNYLVTDSNIEQPLDVIELIYQKNLKKHRK